MEKILSIIIPTYNMEEYLSRCVDSLVKSDKIADLEVFIVNDGSKDRSLEIAKGYESQFPNSVIVIDKPNGNYGSTINAALPRVTGKYVKILDADDWFDTNALNLFVVKLHSTDCDMILTPYTRDYVGGKKEVRSLCGLVENKMYEFDDFVQAIGELQFSMHMVTYKSSILTENGYKQTEGISYTDNEWVFYPMLYINKVEYVNLNIYHHFIGRGEQTMNPKIRTINYWQELLITTNMLKAYNNFGSITPQLKIMQQRLIRRIVSNYDYVMKSVHTDLNWDQFKSLNEELLLHPNIKNISEKYTIGKFIKLHPVRHWNETKKVYPKYLLCYFNIKSSIKSIIK